jgi:uncharacterized membrane protein
MFKQLAIVLGGLLAIAFLISFVLPGRWEITREMQVNAEPEDVHRVAGDLETWNDWSPWGRGADGSAKVTVGPDSSAVGGRYEWKGKDIGSGHAVLTSSDEEKGLGFNLGLRGGREPVLGLLRYEAAPSGGTMVRFTLSGDVSSSPMGRYIALMRGYTTGPDLVDALTRLKRKIERGV